MNLLFKSAIVAATLTLSAQAMAQIILYENNGWRGRTFSTAHEVGDLNRYGFNDKASSIIVENGRWEICDNAGFGGKCMILQKGNYPSLSSMGMNDRISSLRPVNDRDHYDNEAPQYMPSMVRQRSDAGPSVSRRMNHPTTMSVEQSSVAYLAGCLVIR